MNTERWWRVTELFERVVSLTAEERDRVLDEACGDPALRAAVERRLRADADADAGGFLDDPVVPTPPGGGSAGAPDPALSSPPLRLGPYRILHEIGRGGMGTVYAAERDDDAFQRVVAVKVINESAAQDGEMLRRLRAERRILALLEHPNIARIYDGGTTSDDMPYLVMEWVEGEPIDQYCAHRRLSIDERVALMRKVCLAVQYAHRNLVVHRDLKPSNILVTAEGEPKLLDFGIAKLLDPDQRAPGEADDATAPWRRPLSIHYASPEQIRGETISTASDVYSLGVLLFLLLTESLPRSLAGLSPWQAAQRLSTTEPPRPSEVVSEHAHTAGPGAADRRRIARVLRRDLDAIVVRSLRGDPEARYGSAEQFAVDLDYYLRGLPVAARRGTLRYRVSTFVRRHRLAVAASMVALLLGLGLLASLLVSAAKTARGHALLRDEQTKMETTLGFFLDMFEYAGPYVSEGVNLSLRQAVDRQAERFEGVLGDQPVVRAEIISTLGWIYLDLGAVDRSLTLHQEALALRRGQPGIDPLDVAESLDGVAAALREGWQLDEASTLNAEALALVRQHPSDSGRLLLRGLNNRVKLLCLREDWDAADPLSQEALSLGRARFDAPEPEASRAVLQRALVLSRLGDIDAARALYLETLAEHQARFGASHPVLAPLYNNLGQIEASAGRYGPAVDYLRQADAQYVASFGDDFYDRIAPLTNLGRHLQEIEQFDAAEAALRTALDVAVRSPALGPGNQLRYYGRPALILGLLLEQRQRCPEVVTLLQEKVVVWAPRSEGRVVREGKALLKRCGVPSHAFPEFESAS